MVIATFFGSKTRFAYKTDAKPSRLLKMSKNELNKNVFENSAPKNRPLIFSLKWPILTFAPLSDLSHQSIKIIVFLDKA